MAEHHLVPAAAAPVEELDAAPDAAPVPRRGLVLGGAALAGSAIATLASAEPAAAGHNTNIAYDSQTVVHMDVTNTGVGSTRVSSNVAGTAAFVALNNYPVGISRPDGILGRTSYTTSNCAGVAGACESDTGGIGVMGTAKSATGTGVYAYAGSVVPSTLAPAGTGLYADGPDHGVVAVTQNAGGTALSGTTVDGVAVQGWATGAGMAGAFAGPVRVEGPLESESLALTRTSGVRTLGKARRKVRVTGVPVTPTSVVVATLQAPRSGVSVAAATPDPAGGAVVITFTKKAPKGTRVGWILVS